MPALIALDEHKNIVVDADCVESVIVNNPDSYHQSIKVTMQTGDVHYINAYYKKSVYETHSHIINAVNNTRNSK